jgi:hypothetical protein
MFFLTGSPAEANMGLPMLTVVWPAAWVLLIPIILLEAKVGTGVLQIGYGQAVQIAGFGNLVSTLIGIPITWLLLLIIQSIVPGGSGAYGLKTLRTRVLSVTVQSPWLIPYASESYWMVPAAVLCLCVPFFLMSVWTEYLSVVWFTQKNFRAQDLCSWSWQANELSYGAIACIVLAMLVGAIWRHETARKRDAKVVVLRPKLRVLTNDDPAHE